jgi:poly(3-hydroxybutyrate) depolymerase
MISFENDPSELNTVIIRERATEWCVKPDRIGMVGFSAGAFLATDLAMDPRGTPLAFIAPIFGGETQGRRVPLDAPPLFTVVAQGRPDVAQCGRGPLCRLVQRRSPGGAAYLHPRRQRLWRRQAQARAASGPLDRSARRLAGGSGVRLSPRQLGFHYDQ